MTRHVVWALSVVPVEFLWAELLCPLRCDSVHGIAEVESRLGCQLGKILFRESYLTSGSQFSEIVIAAEAAVCEYKCRMVRSSYYAE